MRHKFFSYLTLALVLTHHTATAEIVIKAPTNRGETNIGDYWLATDFAEGFIKLNEKATIDYRGEYNRNLDNSNDINIYMRGYTKFNPPLSQGTNVLYVYYPMWYGKSSPEKTPKKQLNSQKAQPQDTNLNDDWQNFDILAVASTSYAKELNQHGIKAIYIPQFTNPQKFYPAPNENLKTDILFVGSNWHDRTSLRYALESGFEVAVYGYNWENIIPQKMYKGQYIENKDLNQYYASAKIVLNDHRPDMKQFGFVNNRVYDATASGALVISDYMPEIKEFYGDAIPMYQTKEELKELLDYYLTHEKERQKKAQKAREITLKYFTNTTVAKKILEQSISSTF